jgi:hypothetical protein
MQRAPLKIIAGTLAALSFACILSFVSVDHLSCSLKIALALFSVSIPFDVFLCITPSYRNFTGHYNLNKKIYFTIVVIFIPLNFVGIAFVFAHFSYVFAVIFSVSSLTALKLSYWRAHELDKEEEKVAKNDKGNNR